MRVSNVAAVSIMLAAAAALAACAPPADTTSAGIADCTASYPGEDHAEMRADCISAVKVRASGLPVCAEEDSAGPCAWDAWSVGNGVGRSFTVSADGIVTYP